MQFLRSLWAIITFPFKLLRDAVLVCLIIGAGYYFAAAYQGDNELNPEIPVFSKIDEQAYKTDNAFIAAIGLSAPADVKDSYNWALPLVERDVESCKAAQPEFKKFDFKNLDDYKKLENYNEWGNYFMPPTCGGHVSATLTNAHEILAFNGDIKGLNCWIQKRYPGWIAPKDDKETCKTDQEVSALIMNNGAMVQRYFLLSRYGSFVSPPYKDDGSANANLLKVHGAFLADMVLISERTPPFVPLREWLTNFTFLQKALSDKNTTADHAVLAAMYRMSQRALPAILHGDMAIIAANRKALQEALKPYGPANMHAERMVQADYQNVANVIGNLDNTSRNIFYRFQQNTISLYDHIPDTLPEAKRYYHARYSINGNDRAAIIAQAFKDDWRAPHYGAINNLTMNGLATGDELIDEMHVADASSRLLNLYVQIKALQLPPDKIQSLLNNSTDLYDPFTAQPFNYDVANKTIYFSNTLQEKREITALSVQ